MCVTPACSEMSKNLQRIRVDTCKSGDENPTKIKFDSDKYLQRTNLTANQISRTKGQDNKKGLDRTGGLQQRRVSLHSKVRGHQSSPVSLQRAPPAGRWGCVHLWGPRTGRWRVSGPEDRTEETAFKVLHHCWPLNTNSRQEFHPMYRQIQLKNLMSP